MEDWFAHNNALFRPGIIAAEIIQQLQRVRGEQPADVSSLLLPDNVVPAEFTFRNLWA